MMVSVPPVPPDPSDLGIDRATVAQKMLARQVAIIYGNFLSSIPALLFYASVLAAVLWNAVDQARIVVWYVLFGLHILDMWWLARAYVRADPEPRAARAWANRYVGRMGVASAVATLSALLLFAPASLAHQAFLGMLLGLMNGVCVASLYAYLPALHVFMLPTMGAFAARAALAGDWTHWIMAAATLVLLALLLALARQLNLVLAQSLELGFLNQELVARLSAARDELGAQREAAEHAREAAERARQAAEEANMAKSRFLATATHDLRQPLHAIGMLVATLQGRVRDLPDTRRLVDGIESSVVAMDDLFNALLDISKLDAQIVEPSVREFDLAPFLARLEFEHAQLAQRKGLRLRVRKCPVFVRSDPVLLDRIVRNLVSNALRYTDAGGVLIGCRRRGASVQVEVWDTGIGIPAEHQEEIFQEFYRVPAVEAHATAGLGLGLAIVRRLARLLDHPVWFRSTPGRGTRFVVQVPACAPVESPRATPVAAAADELLGAFIVIVDDEAAVRDGMRELLAAWGCHVVSAASGAEAASRLVDCERIPDAIICDYRLGRGETAPQAIDLLEDRIGVRVPALIVTGDTAAGRIRQVAVGGRRLLYKPVPPRQLRDALVQVLRAGRDASRHARWSERDA